MQRRQSGTVYMLLCAWLVVSILTPTVGWSQTGEPLQQVETRLADKRAAAEAHRKVMESIKDPVQLSTAMQQHFQMTEEILALMVERHKLMATQAPVSGTPAGAGSGMQGGGMPGMQRMGHGMMGGMQGGGTQSGGMQGMGMMQKEMGGMQSGSTMPQGAGGTAGSGTSSHAAAGAQRDQATPGNDMQQMMQRLVEHSAYMETLTDQSQLAQEMLRHQKMLDQMLQLMQ